MRRWLLLWLGLGLLFVACEGTDDATGGDDPPRPDGFIFRPTDTAGKDAAPKEILAGEDGAAEGDAGLPPVDVVVPPDVPTPPRDVPVVPPDVPPPPPDVPIVCGADGVGCPCTSDLFCSGYDDGDQCNGHLVCRDGHCAADPTTAITCPAADGICKEYRCQPTTGQCVEVILIEDGRACEDGNPCTGGDTCQAGVCTAGPLDTCGGGGCRRFGDMACGGGYGVTWANPQATDLIELYGCAAGTFSGPEVSYQAALPANTTVVFTVTGGPADRVFLVPGGVDCEVASCVGNAAVNAPLHWKESGGGTYWVIVETSPASGSVGVELDCYPRGPEAGQTCVDRVDNDWDGQTDCTDPDCVQDPFCIPRVCPDGICHPTAEDAVECPEDCAACGDGICSPGYETLDSCPGDCTCGDGGCPCAEEELACGQTVTKSGGLSGEDNTFSGFSCGCSSGGNVDHVFRLVPTGSGRVSVRLEQTSCFSDYDLYVVPASCQSAGCIECAGSSSCPDTATFDAVAGIPYLIVVESFSGTSESYTLRVTCD